MIGILISLVGGLMAAASIIIKFKPDFKDAMAKLIPFQGMVGLVLLGWGVWNLIQLIRYLLAGGFDLISTATVILQLVVGFLLSFSIINKLMSSNSEMGVQKSEALMLKLAGYQGFLGLALMGLSVFNLLRMI